ncbi:MAG: methylated-DNA--[protein]-cysteine S-methyltransferase [Christensenellales bacterium]
MGSLVTHTNTIRVEPMQTPLGTLLLCEDETGLCGVYYDTLAADLEPYARPGKLRCDAIAQLEAYFAGERTQFDLPLSKPQRTPFAQRVMEVVSDIPYGGQMSYGDVALQAGSPRGARAVGNVMHTNGLCIVIPCHRVLAANRGLGGYGEGTLWRKRYLLRLEGIDYQEPAKR